MRDGLLGAGYTADGVLEALGATAYSALARGETVPAERATRGGGVREALIRLLLLQQEVPQERVEGIVPPDGGWVRPGETPGTVRATVDIRPYPEEGADAFVVSDLGCAVGGAAGAAAAAGGVDRADLVLGVGGASTTLAGITVPGACATALDLGTGSGVQAINAARRASHVTATDLNPRAARFAAMSLTLSGVPAERQEVLAGSLFEPVGERRFDLVVSNPPFVVSPAGRFTYRDGGLPGDELCRRIVTEAPAHLEPGGFCQLLANWQHVKGEDWRERLASWIAPTGCDAWVVQREVQDPAQYAELWLRDGGDHRDAPEEYAARYDAWLDAFERDGVEGIGFGWITLRNAGAAEPAVRIEEWPHPVEQPLGPEIAAWFERQDFLRSVDDDALLGTRFRLAGEPGETVQEQVGAPGAEDPEHVVLRQRRGMMRATRVDTVGAGFAGACDGTLEAGRIVDAIAELLEEDPAELRAKTPESIRFLVEQGFLLPVR
ncbi:transferase [Mangrovactinospora gilvigrisea]|uniref:Transferase n=1 Tax=Mangrovactinospora gilvigrisea TaxID=1428644 RepID=A0A1J7BS67_9ACTN|nr:methyltransferase [Mangrovactinospora gilvigrisea]OIV36305.1 transferase [Mangrovactinospora gilvigrisea]